jgi:hypothetical protein
MKFTRRALLDAFLGIIPHAVLKAVLQSLHATPEIPGRLGFQVYPKMYASPLPDPAELDFSKLDQRRSLPGVNVDVIRARELMGELTRFASEIEELPRDATGKNVEWAHTFPSFDTAALYAMLRHIKPHRYIEIGCGYSSRVSAMALKRNKEEGHSCEALYIEPFPPAHLEPKQLPGRFLRHSIQETPLDEFRCLENGDVMFIDTSHVLKTQNDVVFELLEILPLLNKGVTIHVHDVFTPYDYPEEFLRGPLWGGPNEQYALECLISGGAVWKILLPMYALWREAPECVEQLLGGAKDRPASIWLYKTE